MGSDIVSALDRFLADLTGTVVPGAFLATGLFFVIEYRGTSEVSGIIPPTDLFDLRHRADVLEYREAEVVDLEKRRRA